MNPIEFPEVNSRIAEKQEEYVTLPACIRTDKPEGHIVTCFELTEDEIKEIVKTKKLWHVQLCFLQPVQPIMLSTQKPVDLLSNPPKVKA